MDDAAFKPMRKAATRLRSMFKLIPSKFAGREPAIINAEMTATQPVTPTSRTQLTRTSNTPTSRQGSAAQPKTPAPKQRKTTCQTKPAAPPQIAQEVVADRVNESLDQLDAALASAQASTPS